jgi:ankyrin repeat protein
MGACLSSAPTYGLPYGDLSEEAKQLKTELENAGGIDAPDEKFETPLTRALSDKDNARVRMLLDIGANPSCIIQRLHPSIHPDTIPSGTKLGSGYQQNGPPPLAFALNDPEAVRMLLDAGADPNWTHEFTFDDEKESWGRGENLFHLLAKNRAGFNPEVASMLWDRMKKPKAFLNTFVKATIQSFSFKCTPLKTACVYRDSKAVEWMLDHGADVNHLPDADNLFGYTTALDNSVVSKVQLADWYSSYWEHGGDTPEPPPDIDMKDTKCLELLIKKGVDVNRRSVYYGRTATMYAAAIGNAPALRLLLDNGADVNVSINDADKEDYQRYWPSLGLQQPANYVPPTQYTAVQMAADAGHEECVKMLIAKGAKYTP